jgi:transposase-like protein
MEILGNNSVAFCDETNISKYRCDVCNYTCNKKYNWNRHVTTVRHKQEIERFYLEMKSGKKLQKTTDYLCEKCNRKFETASGLWNTT